MCYSGVIFSTREFWTFSFGQWFSGESPVLTSRMLHGTRACIDYESLFLRFTDKNSYGLSTRGRFHPPTGTTLQSESAFCRAACRLFSPDRELCAQTPRWRP